MKTRNLILGLVAVGVLAVAGVLAVIWFRGGEGTATQALVAPTLDLARDAATEEATAAVVAQADATEATETDADATEAASSAAGSAGEGVVFNIVPDESEVRFALDEDLRGQRITVVGITNQVAGQIFVDFGAPANSQVGVIRINARTIATDNEFRNRALRGEIFRVNDNPEFEFIDFTPTAITGLDGEVTIGEPVEFQLAGDLRIRDVSRPVTFDVTVTPESETQLNGTATAIVNRDDFGLTIPSVPSVANVETDVELTIEFVAAAE